MSETRIRSVVIPADRESFDRALSRLLGGMVMSRTLVEGEPIQRESALLTEARARASVDACWQRVGSRAGAEVDITFVLIRNLQGRVERVLVEARGVGARPAPSLHRPLPRFLTFDPVLEHLRRERQRIIQQIENADRLAYEAQQAAAQHGSRIYEIDDSTSQTARTLQEIADALEVVGGGPDPAGHGAEVAIELRIRRDLEQTAARRERAAESLRGRLLAIDREIAERASDAARFHMGARTPGPIGRDAGEAVGGVS